MKKRCEKELDIYQFIPNDGRSLLRRLGKHDWLVHKKSIRTQGGYKMDWDIETLPSKLTRILKSLPKNKGTVSIETYLELFVMSQAVAHGPKNIVTSIEMCEALRHVKIKLPFDDLKLPFPTISMICPKGWNPVPGVNVEVVWLQEMNDATGLVLSSRNKLPISQVLPHEAFETIEESLQHCNKEKNTLTQAIMNYGRVAIMMCLMMINHPWDQIPYESLAEKNARKMKNSKNYQKRKKGRQKLKTLPKQSLLEFKQEVIFFRRKKSKYSKSDSKGSKKIPHWRCGHICHQRCGTGLSEVKIIFRKPILVNAHLLEGDISDTKVNYHM